MATEGGRRTSRKMVIGKDRTRKNDMADSSKVRVCSGEDRCQNSGGYDTENRSVEPENLNENEYTGDRFLFIREDPVVFTLCIFPSFSSTVVIGFLLLEQE